MIEVALLRMKYSGNGLGCQRKRDRRILRPGQGVTTEESVLGRATSSAEASSSERCPANPKLMTGETIPRHQRRASAFDQSQKVNHHPVECRGTGVIRRGLLIVPFSACPECCPAIRWLTSYLFLLDVPKLAGLPHRVRMFRQKDKKNRIFCHD